MNCHCEENDYGFEMDDLREKVAINIEFDEDGTPDEIQWATIRIVRIWDVECECGSMDFRCQYELMLPGGRTHRFDEMGEAEALIEYHLDKLPEGVREKIEEWNADEAQYQAVCAMERRMGC